MIIDADGHSHIPPEVFDKYLDKEFHRNRPRYVTFDDGRGYYIVEGRVIAKPFGWGPGTPGSIAATTRTRKVKDWDLSNVPGRLEDLDLEEIDVQVIYPNVLMSINSWEHAGLASACARAYNTWMAEKCAQAGGRLRFAAVVALQDPKAAADELKRGVKSLGAVGVMVPGTIGTRTLDHPELYPFWEAVEQLDVGVGVHTVTGMYPTVGQELFDHFWGAKAVSMPLTLTTAMVSLVGGGIVDLFPKIRFGLLETGCGWLPYWVERMDEMHERGEKDPRIYDGILNRKHHAACGDQCRRRQMHHVRLRLPARRQQMARDRVAHSQRRIVTGNPKPHLRRQRGAVVQFRKAVGIITRRRLIRIVGAYCIRPPDFLQDDAMHRYHFAARF
jgi:predicted TIM-barrel fold metal-dependent hydrolase